MHTITNSCRWLLVTVFMLGFATTATAQRNVSLRLNTATAPDTLDALDEIQIRGQLGSGTALPDGGVIDWGDATTLKPVNVGGDYWELNFQIPDDDLLSFKFYSELLQNPFGDGSQESQDAGIGGWEDNDPNWTIPAGTGDVDLGLHYFVKGHNPAYDWSPVEAPPVEGMIAVHYRTFMCTADAKADGYNPQDGSQVIGVRGTPEQGVVDWGATNVVLQREGVMGKAGYDLYSGTAFYAADQIGQTQEYKYVLDTTTGTGWEDSDNRTFTIPAADSSLHWEYFGNAAVDDCSSTPETSVVIFSVDLTPLTEIGRDDGSGGVLPLFAKSRGDTLQVRGGFNGWGCDNPGSCLLLPFPGTNIFEAAVPITGFPGTEQQYKFFLDFNDENFEASFSEVAPSGWEEPISTTGANRSMTFEGDPSSEQFLGDVRYNDVQDESVIPSGTSVDVNFTVDMTAALSAAEPFDPATNVVIVDFTGDPIWSFTQDMPRDGENFALNETFVLTEAGDNIYTGSLTVNGPTYGAIQYKYGYTAPGSNTYQVEAGGTTTAVGRRRTRYIRPTGDGSWPATYSFASEVYQPEGTLPFETLVSGVAVEPIDGELPTRVALSQNFPNPFNPTTSIQYSIDSVADVKLQVFDVLGRVVATLVDARQQASEYRVSFDAARLASGTYIYRLTTPAQTVTRSMVLMK
jgi:Secretion system C-terminal sorting domain